MRKAVYPLLLILAAAYGLWALGRIVFFDLPALREHASPVLRPLRLHLLMLLYSIVVVAFARVQRAKRRAMEAKARAWPEFVAARPNPE